jgi:hypothetical protein
MKYKAKSFLVLCSTIGLNVFISAITDLYLYLGHSDMKNSRHLSDVHVSTLTVLISIIIQQLDTSQTTADLPITKMLQEICRPSSHSLMELSPS